MSTSSEISTQAVAANNTHTHERTRRVKCLKTVSLKQNILSTDLCVYCVLMCAGAFLVAFQPIKRHQRTGVYIWDIYECVYLIVRDVLWSLEFFGGMPCQSAEWYVQKAILKTKTKQNEKKLRMRHTHTWNPTKITTSESVISMRGLNHVDTKSECDVTAAKAANDDDGDEPTALHIYYQMALSFNSHLSRVCFSLEIRFVFFFSSSLFLFCDFRLRSHLLLGFRFGCWFFTRAHALLFIVYKSENEKEIRRFSDLSRSFGALSAMHYVWPTSNILFKHQTGSHIHITILHINFSSTSSRFIVDMVFSCFFHRRRRRLFSVFIPISHKLILNASLGSYSRQFV